MGFQNACHPVEFSDHWGMETSGERVVLQNDKYEIIRRVIKYRPAEERKHVEGWVIGYFMRKISDRTEARLDTDAGESPAGRSFTWASPDAVEWERDWVVGMRSSDILGEVPIRKSKRLHFDFTRPAESQIFFFHPDPAPVKRFSYAVMGCSFLFDFDQDRLFIAP